jgi:hypothetical protein
VIEKVGIDQLDQSLIMALLRPPYTGMTALLLLVFIAVWATAQSVEK